MSPIPLAITRNARMMSRMVVPPKELLIGRSLVVRMSSGCCSSKARPLFIWSYVVLDHAQFPLCILCHTIRRPGRIECQIAFTGLDVLDFSHTHLYLRDHVTCHGATHRRKSHGNKNLACVIADINAVDEAQIDNIDWNLWIVTFV